jgi:hypothetical protein
MIQIETKVRGKADIKTEITLDRQTNTAERAAITLEGLIPAQGGLI